MLTYPLNKMLMYVTMVCISVIFCIIWATVYNVHAVANERHRFRILPCEISTNPAVNTILNHVPDFECASSSEYRSKKTSHRIGQILPLTPSRPVFALTHA